MKRRLFTVIVVALLALALVAASVATCQWRARLARRPAEFGQSWNSEKVACGIPLIPHAWSGEESARAPIIVFTPPNSNDADYPLLGRGPKLLVFEGSRLVTESDAYFSGGTYRKDDAVAHEQVIVEYSYKAADRGLQPWSCRRKTAVGEEVVSINEARLTVQWWGRSWD
jgi:hypothetical protein